MQTVNNQRKGNDNAKDKAWLANFQAAATTTQLKSSVLWENLQRFGLVPQKGGKQL